MPCTSLTVDAATAAQLLNISLSHLHVLRKTGRFAPSPLKLGRAVRFACSELSEWVALGMPPLARWQAIRNQSAQQK